MPVTASAHRSHSLAFAVAAVTQRTDNNSDERQHDRNPLLIYPGSTPCKGLNHRRGDKPPPQQRHRMPLAQTAAAHACEGGQIVAGARVASNGKGVVTSGDSRTGWNTIHDTPLHMCIYVEQIFSVNAAETTNKKSSETKLKLNKQDPPPPLMSDNMEHIFSINK